MGTQKLNCAVGDLAVVISAQQHENIGQIVEVMGLQTRKPFSLTGYGHVWQVRTVSGRRSLHYVFRTGRVVRYPSGPVPDCRLRPISGVSDVDSCATCESSEIQVPSSAKRSHAGVGSLDRVALAAAIWGVQLPAYAQRYAEDDYSGSLNLVVWAIFIVVAIVVWLRNRIRHWWNPRKAQAEDDAAEARRTAERKAFDAEMDAHMAQVEKDSRELQEKQSREWAAAHGRRPETSSDLPTVDGNVANKSVTKKDK